GMIHHAVLDETQQMDLLHLFLCEGVRGGLRAVLDRRSMRKAALTATDAPTARIAPDGDYRRASGSPSSRRRADKWWPGRESGSLAFPDAVTRAILCGTHGQVNRLLGRPRAKPRIQRRHLGSITIASSHRRHFL